MKWGTTDSLRFLDPSLSVDRVFGCANVAIDGQHLMLELAAMLIAMILYGEFAQQHPAQRKLSPPGSIYWVVYWNLFTGYCARLIGNRICV